MAIRENDGANSLVLRRVCHVDTNGAVRKTCVRDRPAPVPVHVDASTASVEQQVAGRELLAAQESAVEATNEFKIAEEAATAVVHEDALLLVGWGHWLHIELDVLQRRGLSDLPVDTSTGGVWHLREVNLKVADLAEEVVLIGPPVQACGVVRICVKDSHASEVRGCLQDGSVVWVANELSVVSHFDGCADGVHARRHVDKGGSNGPGIAPRIVGAAGNIAIGKIDSVLDGFARIARDGSEDTVSVAVPPGSALVLDVSQPVATATLSLATLERGRYSINVSRESRHGGAQRHRVGADGTKREHLECSRRNDCVLCALNECVCQRPALVRVRAFRKERAQLQVLLMKSLRVAVEQKRWLLCKVWEREKRVPMREGTTVDVASATRAIKE